METANAHPSRTCDLRIEPIGGVRAAAILRVSDSRRLARGIDPERRRRVALPHGRHYRLA
jgi:hypothetical protein